MALDEVVVNRLLLSKTLLGRIRFTPIIMPDKASLATQILTAHDAAELALAGIAHYIKAPLPRSDKVYLMDYIGAIKEKSGREVPGRGYFEQLNRVRILIKHAGLFPDPKDWHRVGDRVYEHVSNVCEEHLFFRLDDLDESLLIKDEKVKMYFDRAKTAHAKGEYKEVLECLGLAMHALFESNAALNELSVGVAKAEDAIKLVSFGVHGNDYLALQQFLPGIIGHWKETPQIVWEQEKYGHPANWR